MARFAQCNFTRYFILVILHLDIIEGQYENSDEMQHQLITYQKITIDHIFSLEKKFNELKNTYRHLRL